MQRTKENSDGRNEEGKNKQINESSKTKHTLVFFRSAILSCLFSLRAISIQREVVFMDTSDAHRQMRELQYNRGNEDFIYKQKGFYMP